MSTEVVVPALGESVTEAIVAKWFKAVGESVDKDEPIVELETDKVTLEVNADSAGTLQEIMVEEGGTVEVGAILGIMSAGGSGAAKPAKKASDQDNAPAKAAEPKKETTTASGDHGPSPAAAKLIAEKGLSASSIPASGKDGRLTKEDVLKYVESGGSSAPSSSPASVASSAAGERTEERVRMSGLRRKIAERLKHSQNTAAILTTFNDIDMTNVMAMRKEYKDAFEKRFGIRLGFMGFFVKAAVQALKEIPEVNAEIDGDTVVYKNYYDIGVAVGTPSGLVVPVVRNADRKSLAEIEGDIGELAKKARDGKLSMADLSGGTFTVSNGGVYGSLMSTPIINPPQSGILGMHRTEERPVVVNGQVVVRPMMYIALSYDHRIIDGRESVTFLKRVKENIEDPQRLLLEV